jgi:putative membrane-bound dehydrogenase-like protein
LAPIPWLSPACRCALGFAALLAADVARTAQSRSFERIVLSKDFLCEGASFADLDRDGQGDVIAGPYWYRGPDFRERRELYPPKTFDPAGYSDNFFAFPYDFDGDGWTDVLFVGFPGQEAAWYRNPAAKLAEGGAWQRQLAFAVVDDESPAFEDLTGDGRPELICINGGRFGWAEPDWKHLDQPWTFHALSGDLGLQRFTHGLGVGDVDGDGRKDLLEKGGWWKQPPSLANDPAWEQHPFTFSDRRGGAQMFARDVDGDGDNDVITSLDAHEWGLAWFEQRPSKAGPTFVEHRFMDDEPGDNAQRVRFAELHALALADVDGDGLEDIVTGKRWWSHGAKGDPEPGAPAVLYWFRLVREGKQASFVAERIDDDSGVGVQVVAGDVNGDGKTDVVVGNKKGAFVFLQRKAAARALTEEEQIDALLATIAGSKLTFIRNGDEHTGAAAADHLRSKRKQAGDKVRTAKQFIDEVATNSSLSGKPYEVVLEDGRRVRLADWLKLRLAELQAPPSPAPAPAPPSNPPKDLIPRGKDGHALNLGFETGDLRDWTAAGKAFADQPVHGDTATARHREASLHEGAYWIGGYELHGDEPRGMLTSEPFTVIAPWASFLVGGGAHASTHVELLRTGEALPFFRTPGADFESMQRVVVDLSQRLGQEIRIRLVDDDQGGWGHVNFDDFRFHAEEPVFARPPGVPQILPPDPPKANGLSPADAARAMTLPPGFHADVVAAEPDIHQPVAFTIDAKGRLWIAEAFAYPVRRPEGEAPDDILVLEDLDHDGRFEKRTVFAERLDLVSGLEVGFGGVWVGAAPYLLFIPDANDDLVPDGAPQVVLDGWGYQDTHETLNSFTWGPDGWLYGCHGVFTHSRVGAPGTPDAERVPINAGVWRFHPQRRKFEVFAWGTSNPWGIDFDERGQAFITACVIPHLFHVIQGANYERQSGSHFDPHVYDDIKTIADHLHYLGNDPHGGNQRSDAAGGGHAHCGAMIYLADQFPPAYRNTLFMSNIHGNRINDDALERKGSGFVGHHAPDFLLANDAWFRGLNLEYGPDGSVYLSDWYDPQACHLTQPERWDRTNGRLYRVTYGEHRPAAVDLRALPNEELVRLQSHANEWYVRNARLVLQERGPNEDVQRSLRALLRNATAEPQALRFLWALHAVEGIDDDLAKKSFDSRFETVRAWILQLLLDDGRKPAWLLPRLKELAEKDPSPVVRLYVASALQRLPPAERWPIAEALAMHGEDAQDHNLPLMDWFGISALVTNDPKRALELAKATPLAVVTSSILRCAAQEPVCHEVLLQTLGALADRKLRARWLAEIRAALSDQSGLAMPQAWPAISAKLLADESPAVRDDALTLAVVFGDTSVFPQLRKLLADSKAERVRRELALGALVRGKDAQTPAILQDLVRDPALRRLALRGLASFDDADTPRAVLAQYASFNKEEQRDALNTLSSRAAYGRELLLGVERGTVAKADISAFVLRTLQSLKDERIDDSVRKLWGAVRDTPAEKLAKIEELKTRLGEDALAGADLPLGRDVFARTCMQCHVLFGTGGTLGPDLTGSNRGDLDYLLTNLIDPSAVVGRDYQVSLVWLENERLITGIVKQSDERALTLQTENETLVVPREDIARQKPSELSAMPEGQLDLLQPNEIVALVAYLRLKGQVPRLATPLNASQLFDGKDLAGWTGDGRSWSVENGELVGRTAGLARNEFLVSDLELRDFHLTLEVLLAHNQGNSGVQFRSAALENGGMRGYQADVGEGWWGKLYEEEGRGLLWTQPGDELVKPGEWNVYEILAVGHHIRTSLNGHPCVDLEDPDGALAGILALQIHSGGPTEVRFRNFRLELNPPAESPPAGGKQ